MGGNGVEKNRVQELLDSVFFRAPILASALDYPPATFQHRGSEYSFRGDKGSLYWFCPIQIPSVLGMEQPSQHILQQMEVLHQQH